MQATLELVPNGVRSVADIGSGHGALAVALAGRGLQVVATERTPGSLEALRKDLERLAPGQRQPVALRLGDGLAALAHGEVELVVIAGMGGRSVLRILDHAPWLPRWLVLQPMQDSHLVSAWLADHGWEARERRIAQGQRWYLGWLVEVPATARRAA